MTVMLNPKDWRDPAFRRGYLVFWGVLLAVLVPVLLQFVPVGGHDDCEVRGTEASAGAFGGILVRTSCGDFTAFDPGVATLRPGIAYDLALRGVVVPHLYVWHASESAYR